jgi:hypothetical protein
MAVVKVALLLSELLAVQAVAVQATQAATLQQERVGLPIKVQQTRLSALATKAALVAMAHPVVLVAVEQANLVSAMTTLVQAAKALSFSQPG